MKLDLWTPWKALSAPSMLTRTTFVLLAAALPFALCGTLKTSEARRAVAAESLPLATERSEILDALRPSNLSAVGASDSPGDAGLAVDGRDDTAWIGGGGSTSWTWTARFVRPAHVGLIRARFGDAPTRGIPTTFRWETLGLGGDGETCGPPSAASEERWDVLPGAAQAGTPQGVIAAQPTRRSWFVDAEACGVRLVVGATNGGPPVLREVKAVESARDALRGGEASDDGVYPGFSAAGAIDGTYARRWVGAPGRTQWTLRVDLPEPQPIDRVHLVLGLDATSVPRSTSGRTYAIAWGPVRYTLEASEDGTRFEPIASQPLRPDGSVVPLRRRLVTLAAPRSVRALRLSMRGATGADGRADPMAVPVVREIAAYRADDPRPILAAPWVLSVNANPSGQSRLLPGGELADDVHHARLLQSRFASLVPALQDEDLYARLRDVRPPAPDAASSERAGEVLELVEGDDPQLDASLLAGSEPPPITVLSGSNDWDYAADTGPDPFAPKRWHWDPVARDGGMGGLAAAVRGRAAPFLGFCGGAQILGLLEAKPREQGSPSDDEALIDAVLRRTTGQAIRGFAPSSAVEKAWPGDPRRTGGPVTFATSDPLFADLAGPLQRSTTQALPLCHADALRPDAFLPGAPLARFEVLATSTFCTPDALAASPREAVFASLDGSATCRVLPQAFRSRGRGWPVIGVQFHAEEREFAAPAPGDPPESVDDPRLFLAAAYEEMVDAHAKLAR